MDAAALVGQPEEIAVIDALAWGSYGLVVGDAALQGYGVVLLACATAILAKLAVVQPRGLPMTAGAAATIGDGVR